MNNEFDALIREALNEYKVQYEEYLDFMLEEYDVPKDVKLLQDTMLLYMALQVAISDMKEQNQKNREGWYRNNDGRSDHDKRECTK